MTFVNVNVNNNFFNVAKITNVIMKSTDFITKSTFEG